MSHNHIEDKNRANQITRVCEDKSSGEDSARQSPDGIKRFLVG